MVTAVDGEEGRGRFPFMASDDRPKLPRATIRDEKLYVEGEKEPYFQDREHTIRLRVRELTIRRGYLPDYSNPAAPKVLAELLRGIAELEGGNRLAVVGLKTKPNMPIEFDLSPVPDTKTTHHWQASFWFRPHDREFGWKAAFCVNGHCTSYYFDDLLAAVRRGHVDNILVDLQTALWTKDKSTWHVAPPNNREYRNTISSLTWEEKFSPKSDEPKNESKKRQLARLYLLAVAAVLLLLTFLRY
jgi:hypothetical protein